MMEQTVMPRPAGGHPAGRRPPNPMPTGCSSAPLWPTAPAQVGLRSLSQDMEYTMGCLKALGASIQPAGPGLWQVSPGPLPARLPAGLR